MSTAWLQRLDVKDNNIWLHKWRSPLNPDEKNWALLIPKTIKNYPKHRLTLKPIFQNIFNEKIPKGQTKRLFSKYKKDMFQHLSLYGNRRFLPLENASLKLNSLSIEQSWLCYTSGSDLHGARPKGEVLKRFMKQNKCLKSFTQDSSDAFAISLTKHLRYMTKLHSLYLRNLKHFPLQLYKRIFTSSQASLRSITLTGRLDPGFFTESHHLLEIFTLLLALPNLKRFRFDATVPKDFDINLISFHTLHQNHVDYDIRVYHSSKSFAFSKQNAIALSNIEFLGINMREKWTEDPLEWDFIQEAHVNSQERSRKSLFLNMYNIKGAVFTNLFETCMNISTLDLVLSQEDGFSKHDFSGLKELRGLEKLFVHFYCFYEFDEELFENIGLLIRNNPRLSFLSLDYCNSSLFEFEGNLHLPFISFLSNCGTTANSLKHLIFKFYKISLTAQVTNSLHQEINKLAQLETLTWMCSPVRFVHKGSTFSNVLENNNTLQELNLFIYREIPTSKFPTSLRKLSVEFSLIIPDNMLKDIGDLPHLKHLELKSASIFQPSWDCLKGVLKNMITLETAKIGSFAERGIFDKRSLRGFFTKHPSLMLLALEEDVGLPLLVLRKRNYSVDVDSHFWRRNIGIPQTRQMEIRNF